jgi:hypothetical protein
MAGVRVGAGRVRGKVEIGPGRHIAVLGCLRDALHYSPLPFFFSFPNFPHAFLLTMV